MYNPDTQVRVRGERARRNSLRGPFSYATSPTIKRMVEYDRWMWNKSKDQKKTGARKSDPMMYRVHLVKDMGKEGKELWIPLGFYRHLKSAYRKVNNTRVHYLNQRMYANVLRTYTIYIEFRGTGMVRGFELRPEYSLNCHEIYTSRTTGMLSSTSWYVPKNWVLMDASKIRKKTKKKAKSKGYKPEGHQTVGLPAPWLV